MKPLFCCCCCSWRASERGRGLRSERSTRADRSERKPPAALKRRSFEQWAKESSKKKIFFRASRRHFFSFQAGSCGGFFPPSPRFLNLPRASQRDIYVFWPSEDRKQQRCSERRAARWHLRHRRCLLLRAAAASSSPPLSAAPPASPFPHPSRAMLSAYRHRGSTVLARQS